MTPQKQEELEKYLAVYECTPQTRDIIRAHLTSLGKTNLNTLGDSQIETLRLKVGIKCKNEHTTWFYEYRYDERGPYKCGSCVSGALCKNIAKTGSGALNCKACILKSIGITYCFNCAFWQK